EPGLPHRATQAPVVSLEVCRAAGACRMSVEEPRLMVGGSLTDDRGTVAFVNDFDPSTCRRCYVVTNHSAGFVRAWHGHRKEGKYVSVLRGAAIVAAVRVLDWDHPDKNA